MPIYRQLIDQVRQSIRMNLLSVGEQLPSVRVLAKSLQINPMTISKAFAQLEIEGVLIRKNGIGMIVASQQEGHDISSEVKTALEDFIIKARSENLDEEAIIILVQQHLSINSQKERN